MSVTTSTIGPTAVLIEVDNVVWYAPKVAPYVSSLDPHGALAKKVEEVRKSGSSDTSMEAGLLQYGGFLFREYKVGGSLRFFGFWRDTKFCVCLIGNHKGNFYHGMTYDEKSSFAASFRNTTLTSDAWERNVTKAISAIWGMNTTNSPFPLFD